MTGITTTSQEASLTAWTDDVRAFFDQFHSDPAYRDRSWTEVEPEFRSGWMTHYPDRSWDEVAPEVRAHWEGSRTAGYTGTTGFAEGGRTVRLREEELQAHKREVPAGKVQVHKEVVTENLTIEVPVTREEAVIERHPVDRRPADRPIGEGAGETVRVPLKEEECGWRSAQW